jgi:outer membrane protein assembly factor BamB
VYETAGVDDLGGVLWKFETDGPVRSSPTVANGLVYVGSTDGILYALDRETGLERWKVDVESPVSSSPAVASGLVIIGARDGTFYAIDGQRGSDRWRFETGELIPWPWGFEGWDVYTSSPVIVDSIVVFGAGDGVAYALALETGDELWRFSTEGRIRATPAIADNVVFVGSADGRAYALDLATGAEVWRFETDGAGISSEEQGVDRRSIIASPAVANGTVYIGSRDGYMYALDRVTGTEKWRVSHEGSWAMSSPALDGNLHYAGTSDGRFLHAVNVTSGEEVWRYVGEGYTWSSPSVAGSTVFIGDGAGYLRAIARDSGEERWSFRVADGVYSSPVVDDGVVFFGADDGLVYALHGNGQYAHRAVFWDEELAPFMYFRSHTETKVYFEQTGYRVLGANDLGSFLESRIDDGEPSVVVFAMGYLPESVGAEPSDTVLLMRYLQSGGKVVWIDIPPLALVRNEEGRITAFDRGRSTTLLGVDHSEFNFDFYAATPTELGRNWGLERGWVSAYAVALSESIDVLALDENGRAAAWVKSFGGPPGTGYVGIGMDHTSANALEAVLAVADFGLNEQRGR